MLMVMNSKVRRVLTLDSDCDDGNDLTVEACNGGACSNTCNGDNTEVDGSGECVCVGDYLPLGSGCVECWGDGNCSGGFCDLGTCVVPP